MKRLHVWSRVLAGLVMSGLASHASALNLGKAWRGLVDAGADVVTLGEHGRKRDKERAEAAARQAEAERAAAERLRQTQIDALTSDVRLLRDVTKSFESNLTAVTEVTGLQDQLIKSLQAELAEREAAYRLVELARDFFRRDSEDLLAISKALDWAAIREPALVQAFGNPKDVAALDAIKRSQEASVSAIKAKLDVISASKVTEDVYLQDAVRRLKTQRLNEVIATAQQSRVRLVAVATELDASRRKYRAQLGAQVDALAVLSGKDRSVFAAQYEAGLLAANPVTSASLEAAVQGLRVGLNRIVQEVIKNPIVVLNATVETGSAKVPAAAEARVNPAPEDRSATVCLSFGATCFRATIAK